MDDFTSNLSFFRMPESHNSEADKENSSQTKEEVGEGVSSKINPDECSSFAARKTSLSSEEDPSLRRPGLEGLRQRLREILTQTKYQLVVVALVLADMILVVGELMLDLQGSHHVASHVLHYLSLVLLSLFFLEIIVKIFTYGVEFFSCKFEVFDALVVIVALILDIIYLDAKDAHSGLGLIIVLRLWRLVRIQNAMMVQVRRVEERKLEREQRRRMAAEEELQRCKDYIGSLPDSAMHKNFLENLNKMSYECV